MCSINAHIAHGRYTAYRSLIHDKHGKDESLSSWADCLATTPYTGEFVTESPVLRRVREQFADLEHSSLRNDIFLEAHSHLNSKFLKKTHRLLMKHDMHILRVYGHRRSQRSPCQMCAVGRNSEWKRHDIRWHLHYPQPSGMKKIVEMSSSLPITRRRHMVRPERVLVHKLADPIHRIDCWALDVARCCSTSVTTSTDTEQSELSSIMTILRLRVSFMKSSLTRSWVWNAWTDSELRSFCHLFLICVNR